MNLSNQKLESYRNKLLAIRRDLQSSSEAADGICRHESLRDTVHELSYYDNHPADLGSENFEREKDLALHEQTLIKIQEVDNALERIKKGTYGNCSICGKAISEQRLNALPQADTCAECKQIEENKPRPAKENAPAVPLGRNGYAGFDGENAWQAAARYGTSE